MKHKQINQARKSKQITRKEHEEGKKKERKYEDIYIYIYAVETIFWPSLGVCKVNILAKFVFKKKHFVSENTIKIGVSAHF